MRAILHAKFDAHAPLEIVKRPFRHGAPTRFDVWFRIRFGWRVVSAGATRVRHGEALLTWLKAL
jgi:hypothetical protein